MLKKNLLIVFLLSSIAFAQPDSPVPDGAVLEKIATGFKFVEGPVWSDSLGLLFSDVKGNTIYNWSPSDSSVKPYLQPSDSSNGLTFNKDGNLVLTQMRLRRVSRQEHDGTITPLVSTYLGKKFNSPNDLCIKSDGAIFFTDPDFNIPYPYNHDTPYKGIYRISPSGSLKMLDSSFDKPNGICFSPDESKLYVNESPKGQIFSWDVVDDSVITNKKLLYTIPLGGYADGMKTDPDGIIYCTGPTGVWIVSPDGEYIDKIATPETPSNCNWGDEDRKTLYITAGTSVYRIRLATATSVDGQGYVPGKSFELYGNYPNPFNPTTTIQYTVGSRQFILLKIFDSLGKEVSTLVNEEKPVGEYKITFDASHLTSGIYFCTIYSGTSSETKKMVLLQ